VIDDEVWLGVFDEDGESQVVAVTAGGVQVLAAARGWLEPVGQVAGARFGLHAPDVRPGDRRAEPGHLVRLSVP
jgi:hypothetical protein